MTVNFNNQITLQRAIIRKKELDGLVAAGIGTTPPSQKTTATVIAVFGRAERGRAAA
jgi:hypothetical protein